MSTKKEEMKEFNRIYGNLNELFRRIHDNNVEYPKAICARWFVGELHELMENTELRSRLTNEQIDNIMFMGVKICKSNLIDADNKEILSSLLMSAKGLKSAVMQV